MKSKFYMRISSLLVCSVLLLFYIDWGTDLEKAKQQAAEEHKLILLNFSGSDWCIPCINLRHDIFEDNTFQQFAEQHLVLVNADFPRLKKNQLSKEQQKKNEQLADKYNPQGSFPNTLLLDANGNTLHTWEGGLKLSAAEFTSELKKIMDAGK